MSKHITISALDIGTSSIKLLIGQKDLSSGGINILAKENFPHLVGVRKGEIYDPKKVAENIAELKERVYQARGIKIKKVIVGLGGHHIYCQKNQGVVSVSRADQKISKEDIQRVLEASQAINLPSNKEILDVIPQEFIVDEEKGIKDPLGLQGFRLEAKVLLICVFSPLLENLEAAVYESGLEIEDVIPLACSRAVLSSQQRELGVAVVDIGAGTTSLCVFIEGNLADFSIFPVGAANITNDIAIGLRTDIATAERIKKEFGSFNSAKKGKIEIPDISVSQSFLKNIIRYRMSEIFSEVAKTLKKVSKETILPGGVILTGGGSCLPGLVDFAKKKFELPCYLSGPKNIKEVTEPGFSTVAGLMLSGFDSENGYVRTGQTFKTRLKKIFKIFLP